MFLLLRVWSSAWLENEKMEWGGGCLTVPCSCKDCNLVVLIPLVIDASCRNDEPKRAGCPRYLAAPSICRV